MKRPNRVVFDQQMIPNSSDADDGSGSGSGGSSDSSNTCPSNVVTTMNKNNNTSIATEDLMTNRPNRMGMKRRRRRHSLFFTVSDDNTATTTTTDDDDDPSTTMPSSSSSLLSVVDGRRMTMISSTLSSTSISLIRHYRSKRYPRQSSFSASRFRPVSFFSFVWVVLALALVATISTTTTIVDATTTTTSSTTKLPKNKNSVGLLRGTTTTTITTTTAKTTDRQQSQQQQPQQQPKQYDKKRERELIVGGQDVQMGRYPYMVYLSDRVDKLSCGGTLISPTVVLTAAHCEIALVIDAVIGRYNVTEEEESSSSNNGITPTTTLPSGGSVPPPPPLEPGWGATDSTSSASATGELITPPSSSSSSSQQTQTQSYERIRAQKEIQHPLYNRNSLRYDIMLVVLDHPPSFLSSSLPSSSSSSSFVRLHDGQQPITDLIDGTMSISTTTTTTTTSSSTSSSMPNSNSVIQRIDTNNTQNDDDELMAIGWGHTVPSRGPRADFLQQASVGYVPNDVCEQSREYTVSYMGRIYPEMMCTFASGRDACNGDSGGPILIPGATPSEDLQVGVTSWGEDCADTVFPGVGARVSMAYDWIQKWVCAIDGETAPEWYNCPADATFSPAPTTAPTNVGDTIAPTRLTTDIVINLHLDVFANEVSWEVVDSIGNIVMKRPTAYYRFENVVNETLPLYPGEVYNFTIRDSYGDGLQDNGYYQILVDDHSSSSDPVLVLGSGSFARDRTHTFTVPFPKSISNAKSQLQLTDMPSVTPTTTPSSSPSMTPTPPPTRMVLRPRSCDGSGADQDPLLDFQDCTDDTDCCRGVCRGGICRLSDTTETTSSTRASSSSSHSEQRLGPSSNNRIPVSWDP